MIIRPGLLYGRENRLIDMYFTAPGRQAGAVPWLVESEGVRDGTHPLARPLQGDRLRLAVETGRPADGQRHLLGRRFTPARARTDLGWTPGRTDPLAILAGKS
ncbi:hypothetical protein [Streptomyces cadmiisoli]|uniref:hypothetical protein n=1 Tax=Streptomyces cadmiisoli TaxID=2184053 RepID=UPI0018EFF511|nr:hypothetical protein [Streptomyces cadmiisoli]